MANNRATVTTMARNAARISKRVVVSYVVDWISILVIAGIGGAFNRTESSNKRPFYLQDPSITYPLKGDTVTFSVLIVVALVAPGIITAIVALIFPLGLGSTPISRAAIWRKKLWEWNAAWMGLALSLASAFMITEGLKNLAGKPRPHTLAVCRPDLSPESIARYRVGGFGDSFDTTGATPILVDWRICQETDPATLRNTFASWPSGHSSFSFAGLLYLTLFLCAKFSISVPFANPSSNANIHTNTTLPNHHSTNTDARESLSSSSSNTQALYSTSYGPGKHAPSTSTSTSGRLRPAAPPVLLLMLTVFLPIGTAIFVCVSRWFDYHHHGLDIFSGALLGTFTSWFSFRMYHRPINEHGGWAWGTRSRRAAFWGTGFATGRVPNDWIEAENRHTRTTTNTNMAGPGGARNETFGGIRTGTGAGVGTGTGKIVTHDEILRGEDSREDIEMGRGVGVVPNHA